MKTRYDETYQFSTSFNTETGYYVRTNILENGYDTGIEPFMAEFPHLLDIGIMGHCIHGESGLCAMSGTECYQSGSEMHEQNMSLDDYKNIIDQCVGRLDQVALGGRGDPDCHSNIIDILDYTVSKGIVPNFTTSGFRLTQEKAKLIAPYVGAVAVSWYKADYTYQAIKYLLEAGIKTNIHFILSKDSIEEAEYLLTNDLFPKGINRVIFLLHKPVGLGSREKVLSVKELKTIGFFKLFDIPYYANKVGFDSCTVPGLLEFTRNLDRASMEPCEGARFSGYIDSNSIFTPCSFDAKQHWGVDLKKVSIEEGWYSEQFESFRNHMRTTCTSCSNHEVCLGGCPIVPEIVLCNRKEAHHEN